MNGWLYAAAVCFLLSAVGTFIMIDGCMLARFPGCISYFDYSTDVQVLSVYAMLLWPLAIILLVIGVIIMAVRSSRHAPSA